MSKEEKAAIMQEKLSVNIIPIDDLVKMQESVETYTAEQYKVIRRAQATGNGKAEAIEHGNNLERLIEISPKWTTDEPLFRGVTVENDKVQLFEKGNIIDMRGVSSWTSNQSIAEGFANTLYPEESGVVFRLAKTDNGTSIKHLSDNPAEDEVLIGSKVEFEITKAERKKRGNRFMYYVEAKEI